MEVLLLEYTAALYNMRGLLQRKKGQQILDKQLMDSYNIQFCHNNIIIFYIQLLSKVYLPLNPTSVVFNIPEWLPAMTKVNHCILSLWCKTFVGSVEFRSAEFSL